VLSLRAQNRQSGGVFPEDTAGHGHFQAN